MVTIRRYSEDDAEATGRLIADTYACFNLAFVPTEELGLYLGPFRHARSPEAAHRAAIAAAIRCASVWVAECDGQVVGVLRGRRERLASLFVGAAYQRQGIGRSLVTHFERECRRQGSSVIGVAATLYAVPFYLALGYKRSTGVRSGRSFEGHGLPVQPMRKVLRDVVGA